MKVMISTKRLWEMLIYDVFKTYSFRENKWKNGMYDTEPIVGPTYFNDRKNYAAPFNKESVERFHRFYEAVLKGMMKNDVKIVTQRLCSVLKENFSIAWDFLEFFDDDTQELRYAKISCWLMIIDSMTSAAVDKEEVSIDDLHSNYLITRMKELRWIMGMAGNTYTAQVIRNMKCEVERYGTVDEKKAILPSGGVPLFLFSYTGTMAYVYIRSYKDKSKYQIVCPRSITDRAYRHRNIFIPTEFLDIFLSKEEFNKKEASGDLICCMDLGDSRTAYSKSMIDELLGDGICPCIPGDLDLYKEFKKEYPQIVPILLLNANEQEAVERTMGSVSTKESGYWHFKKLCDDIGRIIEEVPETLLFIAEKKEFENVVNQVDTWIEAAQAKVINNEKLLRKYAENVMYYVDEEMKKEDRIFR